jgi:hypothetical protein
LPLPLTSVVADHAMQTGPHLVGPSGQLLDFRHCAHVPLRRRG